MTYQVLARKWRPKGFATLVGQEHVVRALTHALEQQRLHHAYLFTGTRGVGKTTLSRILAKALNCETGITASPCGECKACRAIDEGRFVDYVEMDAASNRGVDEMTSLLEKAVYAPVDARFKVYMIDEVHMLTGHAFNAMLKTLEEPPAHVKFILATTDPQKIPVTVLSRCLQFNLKQMPAGHIVDHLAHILGEEGIDHEPQALRLLAKAANGSMRDALSLTDQAIAYAAGPLTDDAVRGMLGAIDQSILIRVLDALLAGDTPALVALADEMAARSFSFAAALQDLGGLLHKVAVAQLAPQAVPDEWPEAADVRRLAQAFTPEEVQLHYQIATRARGELGLAPDEYTGFSMALLRMAAFRPLLAERGAAPAMPAASPGTPRVPDTSDMSAGPGRAMPSAAAVAAPVRAQAAVPPPASPSPLAAARSSLSPAQAALAALRGRGDGVGAGGKARRDAASPPASSEAASRPSAPAVRAAAREEAPSGDAEPEPVRPIEPPSFASELPTVAVDAGQGAQEAVFEPGTDGAPPVFTGDWPTLAAQLPVRGLAQQLAHQSELVAVRGRAFHLRVPLRQLTDSAHRDKLCDALAEHFAAPVELQIEIGKVQSTAAAAAAEARARRQQEAEAAIDADPFVRTLLDEFAAQIVPGSIRPVQ